VSAERKQRPRAGEWHDVAQGESVESLAAEVGHLPETVWEAPENRSLRDERQDMHVLKPGDRLYLPSVKTRTFDVPTGSEKKFKVKRPPSRLKIQLLREGQPRADTPFVLIVDGVATPGDTDGQGMVDLPISPRAAMATLVVGEEEDQAVYELSLRGLDPIGEVSGVQGRLANLGYDVGDPDGELGPRTTASLAAFQQDEGLEANGKLDDATRDKLKQRHGS